MHRGLAHLAETRVTRAAQSRPTFVALLAVAALLAMSLLFTSVPPVLGTLVAYTEHPPIVIDGDSDFLVPGNGVVGGNGTPSDPFVIAGWDINASASNGITIRNTTAYFAIRDLLVHGAGYYFSYASGIAFTNVAHGRVETTTVTGTYAGLWMDKSSDIELSGSQIGPGTGLGLSASASTGVRVSSNNFSQDDFGMSVYHSAGIDVTNNTFTKNRYGLYCYECSDVVVGDNAFATHYYAGIIIESGGENVSVLNNTILASSQWGLFINYLTNVTVAGNTISGSSDTAMYGFSDTNITIRDNNFTSNSEGIRVLVETQLTVERNRAEGNQVGLEIGYAFSGTVRDNRVVNNTFEGLRLHNSREVAVQSNTFEQNGGPGLSMYFDQAITIAANDFTGGGVYLLGDAYESVVHFDSHTISADNLVNGLPLGYYKESDNLTVDGASLGQLIIVNCTNVRIANLTISGTDDAIQTDFVDGLEVVGNAIDSNSVRGMILYQTDHVWIHDNALSGNNWGIDSVASAWIAAENNSLAANGRGLVLESCHNFTVANNEVRDSTDTAIVAASCSSGIIDSNMVLRSRIAGIDVGGSSDVTVTGNLVAEGAGAGISVGYAGRITVRENQIESNVGPGVYVFYGNHNRVYHNDFVNNTIQAAESLAYFNAWDDGYPSGGNFWFDYAGADACSGPDQTICPDPDYIGDSAYVVASPSQDRYPLMQRFEMNTAPRAFFTVSPASAPANAMFVVNASASVDRQDTTASLEVRWDWEGDGVWDTGWSTSKSSSHPYPLEGNFTIRLQVRDSAGLIGNASRQAIVDSTDPVSVATIDGTLGTGGWFVSPVFVTLTATDDRSGVADIFYRIDGAAWRPFVGRVSIDALGSHTFDYYAQDRAGNNESTRTTEVRVDTVAPTTALLINGTAPINGTIYPADAVVTLNANDTVSGVATTLYRFDGGAWVASSNVVPLAGEHTLEYDSTDHAGNVEATHTFTLRIAGAPLTTSATLQGMPGTNGWFTSDVQVLLTGSGSVSSIRYRIDVGAWSMYAAPFTIADGEHLVEFQGISAGGQEEPLHQILVRVDSEAPELSEVRLPGASVVSAIVVDWSGSDATSGIMRYDVQIDGGIWNSVGLTTNVALVLPDGDHEIHIRALDWAGNSQEAVGRIHVDTNVFSFTGPYAGSPTIALIAMGIPATVLLIRWMRGRHRLPPTPPTALPPENP